MSGIVITTKAVPLTNPRAVLGVVVNFALAAVNLGADTGLRRPVDVIATVDGRVVGRRWAWMVNSIAPLVTAMTADAEQLPLEEFERRWR